MHGGFSVRGVFRFLSFLISCHKIPIGSLLVEYGRGREGQREGAKGRDGKGR